VSENVDLLKSGGPNKLPVDLLDSVDLLGCPVDLLESGQPIEVPYRSVVDQTTRLFTHAQNQSTDVRYRIHGHERQTIGFVRS
jgi:hypothetical protein